MMSRTGKVFLLVGVLNTSFREMNEAKEEDCTLKSFFLEKLSLRSLPRVNNLRAISFVSLSLQDAGRQEFSYAI